MKKILFCAVMMILFVYGCGNSYLYTRSFNGLNLETGTKYDKYGYDEDGYNRYGYNKDGCNRWGYNRYGYDRDGYNRRGYNKYGYDKDGWDKDGIKKETGTKYDKDGYDKDGWDKDGYDKDGWDKDSINKETGSKYDKDGYDKDGYNRRGFDKNGWGKDGWDKDGIKKETGTKYDKNGYDKDGYNKDGWNREGKNKNPDYLSKFKNRKSDDIEDIKKAIEEIYSVKKGEFEKTAAFEEREKRRRREVEKEYGNKILVVNLDETNKKIFKYDADEEAWIYDIKENVVIKDQDIDAGTHMASNAFGKVVEVSDSRNVSNEILFSYEYVYNHNAKTIRTVRIPMKIEEAKKNKGFHVQLLYKLRSTSKDTIYHHVYHHEATIDDPYSRYYKTTGIFAKFVGLIVWDKDMKKMIQYTY